MQTLNSSSLVQSFNLKIANAQGGGGGGGGGIINPLKVGTIEELLDAVAGFIFAVSVPLVTVIVLYGAFQLLTAGGKPDRIDAGKKTITWAIIGFILVIVAGGITTLVENIISGSTSSPSSPSTFQECRDAGNTTSECRGLP